MSDTVFSDTPAIAGATAVQLWVGQNSKFTTVHALTGTTKEDILLTFHDRIWNYGALEEIVADNAAVYCGARISKYLHDLWIQLWQLESCHQNQNYTEKR